MPANDGNRELRYRRCGIHGDEPEGRSMRSKLRTRKRATVLRLRSVNFFDKSISCTDFFAL